MLLILKLGITYWNHECGIVGAIGICVALIKVDVGVVPKHKKTMEYWLDHLANPSNEKGHITKLL